MSLFLLPILPPLPTIFMILIFSQLQFLSTSLHALRDSTGPSSSTCHTTCGSIQIKYPFGTGFGCGHPSFSSYLRCDEGSSALQLATSTGLYTITSIDYTASNLIITDPLMSNCSSMQNSGSFGLDRATPFVITEADTFVLMGCSTTSPLFGQNEDLCDTGSRSRICKGVYSCKGVSGIGFAPNAPVSTCCVYQYPTMGLGSAAHGFSLDLPKLQCSSYTCIYGFGGDEGDPSKWSYGILLQFNTSFQADHACNECDASGGICGFDTMDSSFSCICRNGVNTSSSCYGQGYAWSGSWASPNYMGIRKKMQGFFFLLFMLMIVK